MQKRTPQFRSLLFAAFLCLSLASIGVAQDTATLTGTVRDNSGAVLPGATVSLKNTATGVLHKLQTNSAGEYVAAALPP